jgi:hypothetical protein
MAPASSASFFSIILVLMLLGGVAVVAGLVALAASKGRVGLAILVGLFALLGFPVVLAVTAFLFYFSSSSDPATTYYSESELISQNHTGWVQNAGPQIITHAAPSTSWSISLTPLLFIVFGVVALLLLVVRRGFAHSAAAGHGKIWPALVAVPLIGFFLIGSVRVQRSSTSTPQAGFTRIEQLPPAQPPARALPKHDLHKVVEDYQNKVQQKIASTANDIHDQIDKLNINELMDKFDAPRIALQTPLVPTAPPGLLIIVAPMVPTTPVVAEAPLPEPVKNIAQASSAKSKRSKPAQSVPAAQASVEKVAELDQAEKTVASAAAFSAQVASPEPVAAEVVESAPPKPPAWISEVPTRTLDVRREVITTDEYATMQECNQAADVYLVLKAYERIQQLMGRPSGGDDLPSLRFETSGIISDNGLVMWDRQSRYWYDTRMREMNKMGVTADYLRREIVAKDPQTNRGCEFLETTSRTFGPMKKLHMQIQFMPAIDRDLIQRAENYYRQERFGYVGLGAASVLTLLSVVWGLVRFDTATKGYYTKWLFFGIPGAAIGVGLLSILWDILA